VTDTVFRSPAELAAFQDDVLNNLGASYAKEDGTVFQGQSLSYLQTSLRDRYSGRKWVLGGGFWGFQNALQEAGFKVVRARTMRYTRKGEFKPYQECSVVTL
jgi:hypothetical protein